MKLNYVKAGVGNDSGATESCRARNGKLVAGMRKRPPFDRMKRIFGWLQEGKYPNCVTIAIELEISQKTSLRDIEFMRDRWELPIAYDFARHGYYFTEPVSRFPGVPVTEKELFALCIAHKAMEQYRGTPFYQPLELAFQKCMGQLDDQEQFTLKNLDEVLSFRPFAPDDADLRLFDVVTQAVTQRRGLKFEYRKPGERGAGMRHVHPYHVIQFENRWYLLAHDLARSEIRTFVLGRMRGANLTEERFEPPQKFDVDRHFRSSLGVMTGASDYEVLVEMDAWLTDVLRGRRWHPTQVWTELPGGGSRLRLRLSCLEEIEQWVLSWGTHATVLRPQGLVDRITATAKELITRYEGGAAAQHGRDQRLFEGISNIYERLG